MWSPFFSSAKAKVVSAANPEANAKPYLAFSSSASRRSKAFLVGFPVRAYSYQPVGLSISALANVEAKWMGVTMSPYPPSLRLGSSPQCMALVEKFMTLPHLEGS